MSKIQLNHLTFSNMLSYGKDNNLSLNNSKITQLTAPIGSGKSAIALILQEILFGKNIKNIKKGDILNKYGNKKSWSVSLSFLVDNEKYEVSASRTGSTGKLSFYHQKNGNIIDLTQHKVLDTYKKISEILGMSFEIFSQLTYQSSTDLLDFIKATDTNRKKFLINLFGLEKYIIIGDILKLKISEIEKELNKLYGELDGVNRFLEKTIINEKKQLIEIPSINEALREELGLIQTELKQYVNQCKLIDKNNLLIEERDYLKFDISLKSPDLKITFFEELEIAQQDVLKTKNHIENINKTLKATDTADSCYVCGQPIDNSHTILMKSNLEEDLFISSKKLKQQIAISNQTLKEKNEYTEKLEKFNNNKTIIDRFE